MNLSENINNNTMEISYELNHPWFIYPHAFMSEYNNYGLYRAESVRLENFLGNFICKLEKKIEKVLNFKLSRSRIRKSAEENTNE
jgi:hypothetical protein